MKIVGTSRPPKVHQTFSLSRILNRFSLYCQRLWILLCESNSLHWKRGSERSLEMDWVELLVGFVRLHKRNSAVMEDGIRQCSLLYIDCIRRGHGFLVHLNWTFSKISSSLMSDLKHATVAFESAAKVFSVSQARNQERLESPCLHACFFPFHQPSALILLP